MTTCMNGVLLLFLIVGLVRLAALDVDEEDFYD
jgi:hypothetical protein